MVFFCNCLSLFHLVWLMLKIMIDYLLFLNSHLEQLYVVEMKILNSQL